MNALKEKICSSCNDPKELKQFPFDKNRNRYLSVCKLCMSLKTESYRQTHQDKWKESNKNHTEKLSKLINTWKSRGCCKCNDNRIYVIDAHHLDPSIKEFSIGTVKRGIKITQIELSKCIPLCRNCHAEFHYLEKIKEMTIQKYLSLVVA